MNIQTKPPLTVAEQALFDGFARRLPDLPGDTATADLRDRLIGELKQTGLPTRRIESWHYTDFRALLRNVPDHAESNRNVESLQALVAGAARLDVVNGKASIPPALPEGIVATRFSEKLRSGALAALEPYGDDDAIARVNGSFVTDGISLDIAAGAVIAKPVEIQLVHGAGQAHTRFPVTVGANAAATVVERHGNVDGGAALVSSITDLQVGANATLTWIVVQQQGAEDTHLGQINVTLAEDARLTLHVINAGGKLVRQEIHVTAAGEGADLQLRGINLLGGDSHTDVTLTLGHDVPNTTSTEILRNVVLDRAKGVFQGQIRVAQVAQKTDARMASNTLLLSDDGEFSAKPELEIFADDVQCAHGATVIDIDEVHLFYLMSRGIPETRARTMLVQAFVDELIEELEDEELVDALHGIVESWLEKHA